MPAGIENGISGADHAPFSVDPLLNCTADDIDDLFLYRMLMEAVTLTLSYRAFEQCELLGAGRRRLADPSEASERDAVRFDVVSNSKVPLVHRLSFQCR